MVAHGGESQTLKAHRRHVAHAHVMRKLKAGLFWLLSVQFYPDFFSCLLIAPEFLGANQLFLIEFGGCVLRFPFF